MQDLLGASSGTILWPSNSAVCPELGIAIGGHPYRPQLFMSHGMNERCFKNDIAKPSNPSQKPEPLFFSTSGFSAAPWLRSPALTGMLTVSKPCTCRSHGWEYSGCERTKTSEARTAAGIPFLASRVCGKVASLRRHLETLLRSMAAGLVTLGSVQTSSIGTLQVRAGSLPWIKASEI